MADRVSAVSGEGYNENPSPTNAAVFVPLAVPTDVAATSEGGTGIDLTWTNNSTSATGYSILRSTTGATFIQVGTVSDADDTYHADDTGLLGAQVYYEVVATDDDGELRHPEHNHFGQTRPS